MAQSAGSFSDPEVVADYARATAALIGLPIDDAWWPAVVRHLGALLERAASLEAVAGADGADGADGGASVILPDDPAPVFQP